jgi:general secretion pathway protein M
MPALSPRESRLLAILLLVAALALADILVVLPVQNGFAERARQRQLLLARYAANDRLIGAIPRLARAAAQRDRLLAGYALAASDAGTAADALHDRLQAAATAVGGDFHGAEDMAPPPGPAGPANMVATRVTLRLSAAQLTQFLATLQNARPFVTITALAVRADDTLVTGQATTLEVTLEVAIAYRPATPR